MPMSDGQNSQLVLGGQHKCPFVLGGANPVLRAYSHPHGAKSFSTPGVRQTNFSVFVLVREHEPCANAASPHSSVLCCMSLLSVRLTSQRRREGGDPPCSAFRVPGLLFRSQPFTAVRGRRNPRPACSVFRVPGLLFRSQPFAAVRGRHSAARPVLCSAFPVCCSVHSPLRPSGAA
mgnify:CR=1 FL=1